MEETKLSFDKFKIMYYVFKSGGADSDRLSTKIQQTKILVTCQRFGDLFLFGLIWQYSSDHRTYNIGRLKVYYCCK